MKKRKKLFYIYYLGGICLLAFVITCAGEGLNYKVRTSNPNFLNIYFSTVLELYIIAIYYAWLISYMKAFGTEFTQDKSFNRRFVICIMSLMPIIGLHIILLKLYLTYYSSATLASTGYFKKDFPFFIVPIFSYGLYVLNFPKHRLMKFKHLTDLKDDYLLLYQINNTMQERIDKLKVQNNSLNYPEDALLILWRTTFHLPSLRKYIKENAPNDSKTQLHLYHIVFTLKQNSMCYMILTNGLKWQIEEDLYNQIVSNPWIVSNKKGFGVNMLYTEPKLIQRSHKPDRRWLRLEEELWQELTLYRSVHKLANKLESSRRYRYKFLGFWENSNLSTIDIHRQYDQYSWTI